ncbi:MAG: T9SS type A sorting domain-containing protein [bacterium]
MKVSLVVPALIAVLLAGPAPALEIAGILETNSHNLTVDSVIWQFFSQPGPVSEVTPGWQGDTAVLDTHQFEARDEWPLSVRVCFSPRVGGHLIVMISPIERDTWYELNLFAGALTNPRVMFQETSYVAVAEPAPVASLNDVRLGATILPAGQAVLAADLPARNCRVEVLDATGRTVVERTSAGGRLRLDLAALPAGVYLVRFETADERTTRKLVIR